ncbi:MAG: aryl-sulfate sulfotransferase [Candidatus Cryptobacteroides sp.]
MKKGTLSLLVAATVFAACTSPSVPGEPAEGNSFVAEVEVDCTSNALRVCIKPEFKTDCFWAVKYWKASENEENALGTLTYASKEKDHLSLMFLEASTDYEYRIVFNGQEEGSVTGTFTTTALPEDIPVFTLDIVNDEGATLDGYILQWSNLLPGYITLCDYDGKVVWYNTFNKPVRLCNYSAVTKQLITFHAPEEDGEKGTREIIVSDLEGNVYYSAYADENFVENIHHEVKNFDDGTFAVLAKYVKPFYIELYDDYIDYWGESINIFDLQGNRLFTWNNFDELTPSNAPYIDYDPSSQDYLHGNSIEKDSNGDYYLTLNVLTELWKIDGKTGEVIYRLGEHGNVTMTGETPELYVSVMDPSAFMVGGVHSAVALAPDRILLLNNGKEKKISRAVVVNIDPEMRTARYEMLFDFPQDCFTADRSNVQLISDDTIMLSATPKKFMAFFNMDGTLKRKISRKGISYRAYFIPFEDLKF